MTVFVAGCGRCGTHTLAHLFSLYPNTFSLHEGRHWAVEGYRSSLRSTLGAALATLLPTFKMLQLVDAGQLMSLNVYLYHYARDKTAAFRESNDLSGMPLTIMEQSFALRHRLIEICNRRRYNFVEANRLFPNYITFMRARYPAAKFIHLVRSPYETVASWAKRAGAYPDGPLPTLTGHFQVAEHNRRERRNWILEKPVAIDGIWHERWPQLTRVEKIAWFWLHANRNIRERMKGAPADQYKQLRLEDVSRSSLDAVFRWCGLSALDLPDTIDAHDSSAGRGRGIDESVMAACNRIIGDAMIEFGYQPRTA